MKSRRRVISQKVTQKVTPQVTPKEITEEKSQKEEKEKRMAIPVALISALAPIVTRLFDKDKPLGKTNVATATGGGLMGAAYILITSPDEISQGLGYLLGAIGFAIAMYKENKNKK